MTGDLCSMEGAFQRHYSHQLAKVAQVCAQVVGLLAGSGHKLLECYLYDLSQVIIVTSYHKIVLPILATTIFLGYEPTIKYHNVMVILCYDYWYINSVTNG